MAYERSIFPIYHKPVNIRDYVSNLITELPLSILLTMVSCNIGLSAQVSQIDSESLSPSVITDLPGPGKRVKMILPAYKRTDLYHTPYLPSDWNQNEKYPVIVEYAGNMWKNRKGSVDECNLGYLISGGKGTIWACLPFVDKAKGQNASTWWGGTEATVDYCKQTVKQVCTEFGGDSSNFFIAGFSIGSIACNYVGLYDDAIASLWKRFICHSHYDGVKNWNYRNSDEADAIIRLKRLGLRTQFISQE